jgi:hypothetical protein
MPEGHDRDGRSGGDGGKPGDPPEAILRLRKLHINPEPTSACADAISHRQRNA